MQFDRQAGASFPRAAALFGLLASATGVAVVSAHLAQGDPPSIGIVDRDARHDAGRPAVRLGYMDAVMPHLDALAREGVVFDRRDLWRRSRCRRTPRLLHRAVSAAHGVRDNACRPLAATVETLAELARGAGIPTGGLRRIRRARRLSRPGARLRALRTCPRRVRTARARTSGERPAGEVVDAVLSPWLRARDRRSGLFFLWPAPLRPAPRPTPPPPAVSRARSSANAYYGEVAYADAELGRLLDALRAERRPREPTTVLVVASDHGEAFGEHGELSRTRPTATSPRCTCRCLLRRHDRAASGRASQRSS